ncbi:MAG TPA: cupredoxin domain-containing protein [Pseudomonadales bacterium]|nr:cupredoxin domain-containing protein [Pseudomonadales bacterium]
MKRAVVLLAMSFFAVSAFADEVPEFTLVIKDHVFVPAELTIPAGVKVKLIVDNQDATPEEFESHELNREKVIPGNSQAKIFVGPLEAGAYPFFGEFHGATAQGKLIVK